MKENNYGETVEIDNLRHRREHQGAESPSLNQDYVQFSRPLRPQPLPLDGGYASSDWGSSVTANSAARHLADTPGHSRSATPTLLSGPGTPLDLMPPSGFNTPYGSRPGSFAVCFFGFVNCSH